MKQPLKVSSYTPEQKHVDIADRRTDGFIEAWAYSTDRDLQLLVRSAYLQGLADMADAAAKITTFVEIPQGQEWF